MIIQDTRKYREYIKETEDKVNKLYNNAIANVIPETCKKNIESIRSKIFGELVVINGKLADNYLITPSDWEQHTKRIDGLCKDLSDKVNEAIAYSSRTQVNIR
ncbi:MAG: hypothetical protein IJL21_00890 [Alphaproteobacteria bacterium]|nr:hypothetical protein [Alphaproteobacteria bacterium]